ncbi:MAG: uroporphyrinogen decarboxylase family protein [Ignavibacteriales bacterium]
MNSRERVYKAISLEGEPDVVPWGEMGVRPVEPGAGVASSFPQVPGIEEETAVLLDLGLDIAPVDSSALGFEERIRHYRLRTDLFVMCIVGGGFYECMEQSGFMEFLTIVGKEKGRALRLMKAAVEKNTAIARRAAAAGAHGIMVGDDIAHSGGTMASPSDLRHLLFPLLAKEAAAISEAGCVPMFHSDGDLRAVFGDLIEAGFRVIHSLQPSAGMDLAHLKKEFGSRVCLMGNIELDALVCGPEDQVAVAVRDAMNAGAPGGGFIISTSSGVIGRGVPPGHIRVLREAIRAYGGR